MSTTQTATGAELGAHPPRRRLRVAALAVLVAALLAQMAAGMTVAARQQSATADEGVYIAAAVVYLQRHDLAVNPEHPPLAKLVMGAGLVFADAAIAVPPGPVDEWSLARDVLYRHGNGAQRLLWAARLPMIVLTLLFGLVVFGFARDLAGPWAGVAALAVFAFSPDVIALGSLAGVDVLAAGFLLTTLWLLWRARTRPGLYLPLAGLAYGAALATKMTALAALPVVAVLAAASAWAAAGRQRELVRRAGVAVLAALGVIVVAFAAVWVVYLVVDPHLQWTPPAGLPVVGGVKGHAVDALPLPAAYRDGLRLQLGLEGQQFSGFLFGHAYTGSRWYYLPVALAIKTPLGALALWLAAAVVMLGVRRLRPAAAYVLLPAGVLLAVAMAGSRDWGVRYAVIVPVVMAVAAGVVVASPRRWVRAGAVVLVAAVAVSTVRAFPYYLPYANEAVGGPSQTYRYLGDSNVDWGQDLARLAARLDDRYPGEQVWLVHRNQSHAGYYGITARDPLTVPVSDVHGLLAVSATRVATATGALQVLLGSATRVDQVGHSILIYRRG